MVAPVIVVFLAELLQLRHSLLLLHFIALGFHRLALVRLGDGRAHWSILSGRARNTSDLVRDVISGGSIVVILLHDSDLAVSHAAPG